MDAILSAIRQAGLPTPETDYDLTPGHTLDDDGTIHSEPSSFTIPLAWPGYRIGAVASDNADLPRLVNAAHFFGWKLFILPAGDIESSLSWVGKALNWGLAHHA